MNPKIIYLVNLVGVALITVLWLTDEIGLTVFIALIMTEASLSIWLAVLFMRREKEQVDAFQDLFAAMMEHRNVDTTESAEAESRS